MLKIFRLELRLRRLLGVSFILLATLGVVLLSTSVLGGSKSENNVEVLANQVTSPMSESIVITDEVRAELVEAAKSMVPGNKGSEVESIDPSFDNDGSLDGFVLTLHFPPFTGTLDVPGKEVLVAGGEEYVRTDNDRYVVDGLRRLFVAIDLQTKAVEWVAPSLSESGGDGTITSFETMTKSALDDKGRLIPSNARVKGGG